MKKLLALLFIPFFLASGVLADDFQNLFNGKDLDGWKGKTEFWSVKDGTIFGQTTAEKPTKGNTFLVWEGGDVADFEFTCQVKFSGNNSGVQYRSKVVDDENFVLMGYQADLHPKPEYFGMMYGEKLGKRGIIAQRGQKVEVGKDGESKVVGEVGNKDQLVDNEWNELRIVAVGNRLIHQVNGVTTVDITDNHPELALASGVLGLQLHGGPPMTVEFKDLKLRHLKGDEAKAVLKKSAESKAPPTKKQAAAGGSKKKAPDGKRYDWVKGEPKPSWIWRADKTDNEPIFLRKTFEVPSKRASARLYATGDNSAEVWINGKRVGNAPDWGKPILRNDVAPFLKNGKNVVAVKAQNRGGIAAFVLKLQIDGEAAKPSYLLSDTSWKLSLAEIDDWETSDFDDSAWEDQLMPLGKFGVQPWGIAGIQGPGGGGGGSSKKSPLEPADLSAADGFKVELLYTVPKEEQGSWVALTKDGKGRLIASDQGGKGIYRIAVTESAEAPRVDVEKIPAGVSGAWGMSWFADSLYANINGKTLVRVYDSNGDDQLDAVEELPGANGGGEHGNHAVIPTADGNQLFVDAGNSTNLVGHTSSRIPSYDEDLLLPRQWDARGHARGRMAPGGWVATFDPVSKEYGVYCIGFRNQYDIALNKNGDLFTYDADMEWDLGMPWYRPTRICHVVSGGDYGWRSGTGKWPAYYEDSLPPTVDIGPGSPTGVVSGIGSKFPEEYRDAIFALDWTFGTIYAIHLKAEGAGYTGVSEPFVYGAPLPVTDAIVGDDGALYFAIGGRNTQSALYRVTFAGSDTVLRIDLTDGDVRLDEKPISLDRLRDRLNDEKTEAVRIRTTQKAGMKNVQNVVKLVNAAGVTDVTMVNDYDTPKCRDDRKTRRDLEAFHGIKDARAIPQSWNHLSSEDRFLRHAARIAIESQPVEEWAGRVFSERDSQALITGAVALARIGVPEQHRAKLLSALLSLNVDDLADSQLLGLLRAYALNFIRFGKPSPGERNAIIAELDPLLPHQNDDVNTELIRVLTYLKSPSVIGKAMDLIVNRGKPPVPDWFELAERNPGYGGTVKKMLENHPPSREIGYAFMLRYLKNGWMVDQRRQYFEFLNSLKGFQGGASFAGFLTNLRDEALGNCTNKERTALADVTGENFNPIPDFKITPPKGPGQAWTIETAAQHANRGKFKQASFENGRNLYHAIGCAACHRFGGLGGDIGPDLSSIRNKFDERYVLESLADPSKVISDQYGSSSVTLKNGDRLIGLVIERANGDLDVYPPDTKAEPIPVKSGEIAKVEAIPVSQMPPGLINVLSGDELRDLMAYLMSAGDPKDKVYGK